MDLKRHLPRLVLALALLGAPFAPVPAWARIRSLSNLFVFGDSLSDSGNSKAISNAASGGTITFPPANLGYVGGRFSNGLVAAEYLWQAFNPGDSSFRASLSGGTNYAVGGATTGVENFVEVWNVTPSDLKPDYANKGNAWQLSSFSAASPAFDPETSLFMVWLFPNDPFYLSASSGLGVGTFAGGASTNGIVLPTAVDNIIGTIQELAGFGARNFLVPNSPDLGLIPEFLGSPSEASFTQLSSTFNTNLATALHGLAVSRPDLSIEAFQTDDLFAEVRADPGAFGFSDVSNRCQTTAGCGNGSAEDQSSFLFWDGSHPTTAGHALIGQRFYQAVYEQVPGPLPAAGVVVVLGWSRRLRSRIRLSGASRLQASEPKNQP